MELLLNCLLTGAAARDCKLIRADNEQGQNFKIQ